MFTLFDLKINLATEPFPNLKYRERTALILIQTQDGKFVLDGDTWYPDGVSRMIGGGVEQGEEVIDGAVREMHEETGLLMPAEQFIELTQINVEGTYKNKTHKLEIYVYLLNLPDFTLLPGHDVKHCVALTEEEYLDNVQRYVELKDDHLYIKEGQDTFSWGDYGKVYGFVHKVALGDMKARRL